MFKKERSSKKQKPKKTEDTSWIVEGIVAYLRSPMWTVPVLNFVEENCGEFVDSEENRFEYTEIHQKYKTMVEGLLKNYMKELELTETQFSEACSINNRDIAKLDSKFEYIWAADDFLLFKRLMLKYNAEVQREALEMLQQKYTGPEKDLSYSEEDTKAMDKMLKKSKHSLKDKKLEKQEQDDMQLAIQFSKMEMERLNALVDEERKLLEQAIRLSLESSGAHSNTTQSSPHNHSSKKMEDSNSISLTKPVQIEDSMHLPQGFSASSLDSPPMYEEPTEKSKTESLSPLSAFTPKGPESTKSQSASKSSELPPLKTQKEMTSSEAAAAWLEGAMKGITESPTHNAHGSGNNKPGMIDPEELAKRKAYLQDQRDKLLALKRKERDKQLSEYMEQKDSEKPGVSDIKKNDSEEDKVLASRKSIAERLKREVINKK